MQAGQDRQQTHRQQQREQQNGVQALGGQSEYQDNIARLKQRRGLAQQRGRGIDGRMGEMGQQRAGE